MKRLVIGVAVVCAIAAGCTAITPVPVNGKGHHPRPIPTPTVRPTPTATASPSPSPSPRPTMTTEAWWKPTSVNPVQFHWVLGDALNVTVPIQMGLRDFSGNPLPAPNVIDIDGESNTVATVASLHAQGKKVICYIDAGVYETYRSDAHKFPAGIWGNADSGWNGSFWLDIRRIADLAPIIQARMQMCKDKGFDAIEPDEIDGWENNTGFPLTYQDQLRYNRALAQGAHNIGMSIGQKGDLIQAHDLVTSFDWTLNEECYQYKECTSVYDPVTDSNVAGLQVYTAANKMVLVVEYKLTSTQWTAACADSRTRHFNMSLLKLGLPNNGGRQPCSTAAKW